MRNSAKAIKAGLLASICIGAPALAQAPDPQPQSQAEVTDDAAPVSTSPNDVVVTARRRAERVQDIAATIDVLGGQALRQAGVTSASQIEFSVPGLQFGNAGFDGSLIGLRGVSSQRGFTGDEAAVAVHIDGVFQPQSSQALARLFDVDRVEVLKGPQGTLYGRNANAGVINIVTTAPSSEVGGYARLSYGSFRTVRGEGAVNLPLGPDQALRVSVAGAHGRGFIKNILDNRTLADNKYVAGRLRYRGTFGRTTVDLSGQYVSDNSENDGALTPARRAANVRSDRATGFYDTIVNIPTGQKRRDGNLAAQADVDLGSVGFKSITGATHFFNRLRADTSLAEEPVPTGDGRGRQKGYSLSEELTLYARSPTVLDWRAGLYYTFSDVTERRYSNIAGSPSPANNFYDNFRFRQTGNAYAVYADAGWKITDRFKLTLGGRYNIEDKDQRQAEVFGLEAPTPESPIFAPAPSAAAPDCAAVPQGSFATCYSTDRRSKKWKGATARAGLDYAVTRDNLLYANYGRGFRSGAIGGIIGVDNWADRAFGGTGTLRLTPLNPEKVDAFEVGTKNSFANGRFVLNLAGFYTIFKDQLFIATDPLQNFRSIEGNLGKSKIKGFDAYAAAELVRGFQLSANIEVLDAKIDKLAAIVAPDILVGNRLPRAPKFSAALAADWRLPVGPGNVDLRAEYNYKGRHFFNLQNTLSHGAVGLVNLSARYEQSHDHGWYLLGALRNLTGKHYLVAGGIPSTAGARFLGAARPGEPFTFEVGGGIRF